MLKDGAEDTAVIEGWMPDGTFEVGSGTTVKVESWVSIVSVEKYAVIREVDNAWIDDADAGRLVVGAIEEDEMNDWVSNGTLELREVDNAGVWIDVLASIERLGIVAIE